MNRVLELIFSRLVLLLMLLAVPLLIAVGIMYLQPRQYEASATLIALRRYEVVGATGPESDLTATPAVTQAAAITEILQTQSVALAIRIWPRTIAFRSKPIRRSSTLTCSTISRRMCWWWRRAPMS
jgi:hypothetical protein